MKRLPGTILCLLLTYSGICQTPFLPLATGNFHTGFPVADTATTRVSNGKLRFLIKANEAGKLCLLKVTVMDSIERAAEDQIFNLQSEVHTMQIIDAHSTEGMRLQGEQINELKGNNLLYKNEVTALQKEVRKQLHGKRFISVLGAGAILFLSYLLIK